MASTTVIDRITAVAPATTGAVNPETPVRSSRLWEGYFLALVLTYLYVLFGWWLRYHYHFALYDSLARTNDAKEMIFSRDPHAAALGVYWMPLPTVVQLPLLAILEPLRHPDFAGPLSTALFGGGTILVLTRICRDLGLSRVSGFFVSLAYGLNPVIAYYAANGMSEGAEFFFIAVALWGLLRFVKDERNSSAVIAATGLAGLAMSKYEALPVILLASLVLVGLQLKRLPRGQWHETALNLSIIVLPSVFFVGLWLIYQKFILGSFFAFRHVGINTGNDATPGVRALVGSWPATIRFVAQWMVLLFPPAALLIPALILPPWRKMMAGFTVAAMGVLTILTTAYYIYTGRSVGEPRYFTPIIIVGTIALVLVAARLPRRSLSHFLIDPAVVLAVVVAGYSGAIAEAHANTSVEGEPRVFKLAEGIYDPTPGKNDSSMLAAQTARKLDSLLRPGDRVLIDERYDSQVNLFSTKSDQVVTNSDRDYEQLVSPTGIEARIGFAILPHDAPSELHPENNDAYLMVHRESGWREIWHNDREEIWQRDEAYLKALPMPPRG